MSAHSHEVLRLLFLLLQQEYDPESRVRSAVDFGEDADVSNRTFDPTADDSDDFRPIDLPPPRLLREILSLLPSAPSPSLFSPHFVPAPQTPSPTSTSTTQPSDPVSRVTAADTFSYLDSFLFGETSASGSALQDRLRNSFFGSEKCVELYENLFFQRLRQSGSGSGGDCDSFAQKVGFLRHVSRRVGLSGTKDEGDIVQSLMMLDVDTAEGEERGTNSFNLDPVADVFRRCRGESETREVFCRRVLSKMLESHQRGESIAGESTIQGESVGRKRQRVIVGSNSGPARKRRRIMLGQVLRQSSKSALKSLKKPVAQPVKSTRLHRSAKPQHDSRRSTVPRPPRERRSNTPTLVRRRHTSPRVRRRGDTPPDVRQRRNLPFRHSSRSPARAASSRSRTPPRRRSPRSARRRSVSKTPPRQLSPPRRAIPPAAHSSKRPLPPRGPLERASSTRRKGQLTVPSVQLRSESGKILLVPISKVSNYRPMREGEKTRPIQSLCHDFLLGSCDRGVGCAGLHVDPQWWKNRS